MEPRREKLPEGWSYHEVTRDFITPWGPRYVQGQTVALSAQQAADLEDKGVLEGSGPPRSQSLSNAREKDRPQPKSTEEMNLQKTHPGAIPVQEKKVPGASGPTSKKEEDDDDDNKKKGKK